MTTDAIPDSWREVLSTVLQTAEARKLGGWLAAEEAEGKIIYPPRGQRLRALELTPLDEVKAVILGQDPYHGPGQAHGLSFSVAADVKIPPSLVNIYKELESDLGIPATSHGNLEHWARQGVLLLNTSLTVEAHHAGSHAGKGWDAITDAIIASVANRDVPSAFVLWGSHAQKKGSRIDALKHDSGHLVIRSPHPSPLSSYRGFFGSKPFSAINTFLAKQGRAPIDWQLPEIGDGHDRG